MSIKKVVAGTVLSALMLGGVAGSVAAAPSACGEAHGAFASEYGNFGFLGEAGGTPGYHNGARGQQPGATGYNNSHTNCQG
jgi:hypothetical protein